MVLVAEGATDKTYAQLKKVLRLPNDLVNLRTPYRSYQRLLFANSSAIELLINQALFSDVNLRIQYGYVNNLKNYYEVDHVSVNFKTPIDASDVINDHISKHTLGKIRHVVKPDDLEDSQLLLTSSIFFRGQWKVCFNLNKNLFGKKSHFFTHSCRKYFVTLKSRLKSLFN